MPEFKHDINLDWLNQEIPDIKVEPFEQPPVVPIEPVVVPKPAKKPAAKISKVKKEPEVEQIDPGEVEVFEIKLEEPQSGFELVNEEEIFIPPVAKPFVEPEVLEELEEPEEQDLFESEDDFQQVEIIEVEQPTLAEAEISAVDVEQLQLETEQSTPELEPEIQAEEQTDLPEEIELIEPENYFVTQEEQTAASEAELEISEPEIEVVEEDLVEFEQPEVQEEFLAEEVTEPESEPAFVEATEQLVEMIDSEPLYQPATEIPNWISELQASDEIAQTQSEQPVEPIEEQVDQPVIFLPKPDPETQTSSNVISEETDHVIDDIATLEQQLANAAEIKERSELEEKIGEPVEEVFVQKQRTWNHVPVAPPTSPINNLQFIDQPQSAYASKVRTLSSDNINPVKLKEAEAVRTGKHKWSKKRKVITFLFVLVVIASIGFALFWLSEYLNWTNLIEQWPFEK